ncbi:nucleoside phosphorylase [Lacticaseibacillus kribbianus]|uniref:nucleoside phosphorylase n=1 Tax=Lacticaseibacillus kribbianus TaxID=2926292 RepID=UPI001CD2C5F0|nr:nucleoside phosphorylase [Lacticaseibacillus kribbianus]
MSLPITDYDAAVEAVIAPNRGEGFAVPPRTLLAFVNDANFAAFLGAHPHRQVAEYETIAKHYRVYALTIEDEEIGLCQAPLGAPAAVQLLDFLIGYGARTVVAVGSCGVLVDTPENQLMVVTAALRDEGTSYHYLPPAASVATDAALSAHLLRALASGAKAVATWTNDAYYRETPGKIARALAAGCEVVEMECAALCACAVFRGARFGQVLFTADSLAELAAYDARGFGVAAQLPALTAAGAALVQWPAAR